MKYYLLLTFALITLVAIPNCKADSLFPVSRVAAPNGAAGLSLYSDNKARNVGDILTIVINENESAASQATTKNSKVDSFSYGPGTGPNIINFGPIHLGLGSIPALGLGGNISSNASGTTNRSDTLNGEITVVVKQVLPNGNLMVEGTRAVSMNAETETITLTGIVRPEDISSTNTVQSPQVADAEIHYGGKGPVGDKQHDGLISRLFKILF